MKEGDKLHTFTILEDLGHGGMGGVYIGFDTRTKKLVAIKTLFQEFSREQAYVLRFQREAEVYRKMRHPNMNMNQLIDKVVYNHMQKQFLH